MAIFTYKALDPAQREIRLLDLVSSSGIIQCHLRHLSLLENDDKYEALSYCWGPPSTRKAKILVNESTLSITPSLLAALLRLRRLPGQPPRSLWIDAICINQQDAREKSFQIPLMRDIYSSSQNTIVWLGEHDSFTDSAFHGLQFMASMSRKGSEKMNYYDWKRVQRSDKSTGPLDRLRRKTPLDALQSGAAFTSLFTRPWFTRLWVIQEVTLSPRSIVICGKYEIDWSSIAEAYAISKSNFDVQNHVGSILRFRDWPRQNPQDILGRMIMSWHQQVTDPRDKIYGLMGLVSKSDQSALVNVNYEVDVGQIFTDFTQAYLKKTGNLQVLAICRGCKSVSSLDIEVPSWVIDHEYDNDKDPLPYSLISWGSDVWGAHPQGLRAGGQSTCVPQLVGNLLGLEGFVLDHVVDVSIVNESASVHDGHDRISANTPSWVSAIGVCSVHVHGGISSWRSAISFSQWYLEARHMCHGVTQDDVYGATGQTMLDAFWQVIRGRRIPIDHEKAEPGLRKQFESFDRFLTSQTGRAATIRSITSIIATMILDPSQMEVFSHIGMTKQRRFLITKYGYMGIGPRETKVGDAICLLRGYQAPVIARRLSSSSLKVVGDTYLHGIMDGEAFNERKSGTLWFE